MSCECRYQSTNKNTYSRMVSQRWPIWPNDPLHRKSACLSRVFGSPIDLPQGNPLSDWFGYCDIILIQVDDPGKTLVGIPSCLSLIKQSNWKQWGIKNLRCAANRSWLSNIYNFSNRKNLFEWSPIQIIESISLRLCPENLTCCWLQGLV